MSIAGEIQYKVVVDTKSLKSGLDTADKETKSFADKAGNAMAGTTKAIGKAVAGAAVATTAAIAGITKKSVESYADFEQLSGGVEKLFGDASQAVIQNASQAFKTAGLTANEYMEQATSFSASLVQSLGGDTAKAAQITDMAITDMADNMNTFGTDMESIQHAYQGFAKQNYSMLDNLRLGYGGTKSEMQRLLDDATKLTGVKYDINNLSDVYEAIHAIQVENKISGLTAEEAAEAVRTGAMTQEEAFSRMGTTAKEASSTISGSIGMMKASWGNMLTAMGTGEGFGQQFNEFTESLHQVATNILPVVKEAILGAADMIGALVPDLVGAISSLLPELIPTVLYVVQTLFESIVPYIPDFIQMLVDMIPQLIQAIMTILDGVLAVLPDIIEGITTLILAIVQELTKPETLTMILNAGIRLLLTLVKAIPQIIEALYNAMPDIINGIIDFLTDPVTIKSLILASVELFMALVKAIPQILGALFGAFSKLFSHLWEKLKGIFTGFAARFGDAISGIFKGAINAVLGFIEGALNAPIKAINGFIGIINKIPGVSIGQLSLLQLPRLATGGIVPSVNGGQLILAGEGGQDEWVVPESKMADMVEKLNERSNGIGNGVTINISGVFATSESEQRKVAEQIYQKLTEINKSRMGAYI